MRGRLVEIKDSVRLHRASERNLALRVETLMRKANARATKENAGLGCIFVHEDLDRTIGPVYYDARRRVQHALEARLGSAHYALAVAEIEAWVLLFPRTLESFRADWKVPAKYNAKDTGRLSDPKRILTADVSRRGSTYRETDGPDILKQALEKGETCAGTNRSWSDLLKELESCCGRHLKPSQ